MHTNRSAQEIAAEAIRRFPAIGTRAYVEAYRPKLSREDFLAKIHTPTHPGPGGKQR